MAKKIQELTKELSQKTVQLHTDVSKTKSAAEKLLADLKKIETGFAQKEEAAIAEQKRLEEEAEQRRIAEERAALIEAGEMEEEELTEEEQRQLSEKQTLQQLIDQKPAEVAMLIKTWLAEE